MQLATFVACLLAFHRLCLPAVPYFYPEVWSISPLPQVYQAGHNEAVLSELQRLAPTKSAVIRDVMRGLRDMEAGAAAASGGSSTGVAGIVGNGRSRTRSVSLGASSPQNRPFVVSTANGNGRSAASPPSKASAAPPPQQHRKAQETVLFPMLKAGSGGGAASNKQRSAAAAAAAERKGSMPMAPQASKYRV